MHMHKHSNIHVYILLCIHVYYTLWILVLRCTRRLQLTRGRFPRARHEILGDSPTASVGGVPGLRPRAGDATAVDE